MTPERREYLLSLTELGREVLTQQKPKQLQTEHVPTVNYPGKTLPRALSTPRTVSAPGTAVTAKSFRLQVLQSRLLTESYTV